MGTYNFTGNDGDGLPAGLVSKYGTFEIQNNALIATGSSPSSIGWVALTANVDPTKPVSMMIQPNSGNNNKGIVMHYTQGSNTFVNLVLRGSNGTVRFHQRINSNYTQLAMSPAIDGFDPTQFYKLTIEPIEGDTPGVYNRYNCYLDDALLYTVDAGAGIDTESTYAGIRLDDAAAVMDDFTFSDYAGPDTLPPEITLQGYELENHFNDAAYVDAGYSAYDATDGAITVNVTGDTVSNTPLSIATILYDAEDAAGNQAEQKSRTVYTLSMLDTYAAGTKSINAARSWWMSDLDTVNGNVLISSFIDKDGGQGIAEFDVTTGDLLRSRIMQMAWYPEDEHSPISHKLASDGRLICFWTGHGVNRNNEVTGAYFASESADGTIANLTKPVRFDFGNRTNYMQIFENTRGDIVALTNDDDGARWFPIFRTGVNQWVAETALVDVGDTQVGGTGQYYVKGVMVGEVLRMFGIPHASNEQTAITLTEFNTVTHDLYTDVSTIAGNSLNGDLDTDPTIAPAVYANAIATAGAGRSQRLLDVSDDGLIILVARYDDADGANGEYGIYYCTDESNRFDSSAWSYKTVTTYDSSSYLDTSRRYVSGGTFAREVEGVGLNLSRKVVDDWLVERYYASDITGTFTSDTMLTFNDGSKKIARPNSPVNATKEVNTVIQSGYYSDYQAYNMEMYVADYSTPDSQLANPPSGSISVDDNDSQKAWSNNGGSNASVTITGSYTGSPTSLQRSVNGGAWTTFEASPSGETWSDTFTLANGAHSISYRFSNDTGVIATINPVVVGQVVVPAGQSNPSGRGLNPQTLVPSQSGVSAYLFGNDDKLKVMQDPYDDNTNQVDSVSSDGQAGGSWSVIFANKWLEESDVPLIFIPVAKGGSNITEWSRNESSSTLYGSMKRRIEAVGGVDIMFWQQGEKNASNSVNTSQTGYKDALVQLAADIQSDFGVKTFVIPLHTITASGYDNQDTIRQAQIDAAAESANIEIGQALTDIDLSGGDGLHFQEDADIQLVGERVYNSFFGEVVVPNQPPVANAGPDQSVAAATQFTLDGTGSQDTDGIIVEWRWTQTAGDTVTLDLENSSSPRAISPSKTTPQTLTFSLVTVDDEGAASSPSLVNIDVAAVVQNDVLNIIDKISFTFESDGMITAFPGRANRETFRLKPSDPTGLVLEDGWFDFEANDVRRVEISMLETTGVKIISSDTDSITRERSKLHVRMGDMPIKSSTKEFEPTVSVFVGDDERGVVMTAPGLSGAPKVKYYSTTARAV